MSRHVKTSYHHIQRSPFFLLHYAVAAGSLVAAWFQGGGAVVSYLLMASGVVFVTLAGGFQYLVVKDEGDQLRIAFGPLPLFATSVRYNEITAAELDRTTILEGWGIHKSLRGGWVWNIWGRDCVAIHHDGITRVGTDDAEKLAAFLRTRAGISNSST